MSCISSLRVVVFPAPFGPRKPKVSPFSTSRFRPSSARYGLGRQNPVEKSFVRLWVRIANMLPRVLSAERRPALLNRRAVRRGPPRVYVECDRCGPVEVLEKRSAFVGAESAHTRNVCRRGSRKRIVALRGSRDGRARRQTCRLYADQCIRDVVAAFRDRKRPRK